MKEPIEELFKQSLKGHEMPFNPDAWKAMSARLDAVQPVVAPKSYMKYYLGAAGMGAAAIATYFFFANGDTPATSENPITSETKTEQTITPSNEVKSDVRKVEGRTETTESNSVNTAKTEKNRSSSTAETRSNSSINTQGSHSSNSEHTTTVIQQGNSGSAVSTNNPKDSQTDNGFNVASTTTAKPVQLPSMNDLCLNESVTVNNPNETEIYILDAVGNTIKTIPAKKTVLFKPSVVGSYALAFKKEGALKSGSHFQVNRIPDADFTVDMINKYDRGLPATHVEGISGQGTYIWKAEGQTVTGVEADLHFYEKGEQTIELTVNNGQCESTVEKTIYVESDYNLMAVKGFTPTSTEPKNQTFIPFALTQRDVKFEMTIIDSRDGGVVYKTSDASLPWDGTDIRSGRRSETPQVYVWKVVILNPAPNEPGEYVGTITMN